MATITAEALLLHRMTESRPDLVAMAREAAATKDHCLRESATLQAVFAATPDPTVLSDASGNFVEWNNAAKQYSQMPDIETPPEDWAEHFQVLGLNGEGFSMFATDVVSWSEVKMFVGFIVPIIGAVWYLSRRLGRQDETLARIEEREKNTHERIEKVEEGQKETQKEVTQLRERVGIIEARAPANGVSS